MARRMTLLIGSCAALALLGCDSRAVAPDGTEVATPPAFSHAGEPERADVMNQGGVGVYAEDGATLVRQANGLRMGMTVPTPAPGTYVYPDGATPGHPEVFTLWAFVFNFPHNCTVPCNGDDLGTATGANGGVYNVGGHVGAGGFFTISGRIGVGEAALAFAPLTSPETAEVHLALTSHGALDPATLPGEFRSPTGSPACGCWWVAIFD